MEARGLHPRRPGRARPRRRLRAGAQGRQAAARRRTPSPTRWSTARPPSRCTATRSRPGDRVLLVDDVLATGGTVAATRRLVEQAAAAVARGVAVLMDLSFLPGREAIGDLPLTSLLTV